MKAHRKKRKRINMITTPHKKEYSVEERLRAEEARDRAIEYLIKVIANKNSFLKNIDY